MKTEVLITWEEFPGFPRLCVGLPMTMLSWWLMQHTQCNICMSTHSSSLVKSFLWAGTHIRNKVKMPPQPRDRDWGRAISLQWPSSFLHHKVKTQGLILWFVWFCSSKLIFNELLTFRQWGHLTLKMQILSITWKITSLDHIAHSNSWQNNSFWKWNMSLPCLASTKAVIGHWTIHPACSAHLGILSGLLWIGSGISPKAHVLKIWSPGCVLLGGGETFKVCGLVG
jgi:hypothetical protein